MAKNGWIPEISDGELDKLTRLIKAVVDFPGEGKYYIKPVGPRTVVFTWDPKPDTVAEGLKPLLDIRTYHAFAFYGFFKPTIAEVIAQIPNDILDQVVAFEIIKHPETTEDLNNEKEAINAGYHVATTRLYTK
ncbi:MAG: hypothetical protein WCT77_02245 [Bacteroidota bacterium]|jgi:hypothetical protein